MDKRMVARGLAVPAGYGLGPDPGPDHLPWPDVMARIDAGRSWWICTTRSDGRPHAAPVWGIVIDGRLIFSSDPQSVKGRNLAHDERLAMHLESGDEVVIVEGRVKVVRGDDLPEGFADRYESKYDFRPDVSDPGGLYYEVEIDRALVWDEADFVRTAAVWEPAG